MKNIETEITISASPEKVWSVLTDFEKHPDWNPFIKSIEGEKLAGKKITVSIQPPDSKGMTFKPLILNFEPNKELRWKGSDTQTKFIQGEEFSGVLVWMMGNALNKTQEGFKLMNEALKKECEK